MTIIVGTIRLSEKINVFVVVVQKALRGQGLGKRIMSSAESYAIRYVYWNKMG